MTHPEPQPVDLSRLATPGGGCRRAFSPLSDGVSPHPQWATRFQSAAQPYGSGCRTPHSANAQNGWHRRDACKPPAALT